MSWILNLNLNFKEYESLFFKNLFFLSFTANSVLTYKGIFLVFSFKYFFEFFLFYDFAFAKRNKWCSNFQRFSTRHFKKICKVGEIVCFKQLYVLSINEISTLKNKRNFLWNFMQMVRLYAKVCALNEAHCLIEILNFNF